MPQRLTLCGQPTVLAFGRPVHLADRETINRGRWRE
jgi:hypothetical protein